jgi:nitrite reductase (cytochrome c-552)
MQRQYDGWQKASHHGAATCVDCHLPHSFLAKYLAKASNGWHHSKGFTLQDFEEPIRIKPGNSAILLERGGQALVGLLDAVAAAKARGATAEQLAPALALQRKAQWRLDFIAAENSMGFHAPQEAARVLGEAIDHARQGQIAALTATGVAAASPPAAPSAAPPAAPGPAAAH